VKLERHVGGLSVARKETYLTGKGWRLSDDGWRSAVPDTEPLKLSKAVHHQLTKDLTDAMVRLGWKVVGYSPRGYVKLEDSDGSPCSLPKALRTQARREKRPVGELTYSLFLAALL